MHIEKQVWLPNRPPAEAPFFGRQALEHSHNNSISGKVRREEQPTGVLRT